MNYIFKFILYPFSFLYGLIIGLRNWLYERKIFKYTQFDIPVISVGNLTVGGTGKTPMVEYLIDLLSNKYKIGTLSRGYGRKTCGFQLGGPQETAYTLGDEPFQLYQKYGEKIVVSVGEERILAVPRLLYNHPEVQVILLDDAFQHRAIKPSFQILLNDYNRPFYKDSPMPAGRLREFSSGAKRADVVVVTKCPQDLSTEDKKKISEKIKKLAGHYKKVFFTSLQYEKPVSVNLDLLPEFEKVVLITGIASVAPLLRHVEKNYEVVKHFKFPDHHFYKQKDIDRIINYIDKQGDQVALLTTEKDAVKLQSYFKNIQIPLYMLAIKINFLDNEKAFHELVFDAAEYKED